MLSRLGRNDGGRETWLYNFVPRLLALSPNLHVKVFGIGDRPGANVDADLGATVGEEAHRFTSHLFPVTDRAYPVFFQMWRDLVSHTRSPAFGPPDLVLGMGIFELIMLATGGYRKSRKVIWLRGIFLHEKAGRYPASLLPLFQKLEVTLLRRVDRVLAIGDDIADHYRARGIEVDVVENGVDLARWGGVPSPKLRDPIQIAFIGRLAEVKGINEYLEAVRIAKSGPAREQLAFHVVGAGSVSTGQRFGSLRKHFQYHGPLPNTDLPSFLGDIDVCVALTWARETGGGGGTSNALLEQMAAGRVIVAWDSPIFRQVLDDDSAYFVPQGDAARLAKVFADIAADPVAARRRAARAAHRATAYAMDGKVQACLDLLNETMGFTAVPGQGT